MPRIDRHLLIVVLGVLVPAFAGSAMAAGKAVPPRINAQLSNQVIYPKDAQIAGEQGDVVLALLIGAEGHPRTTYRIITSSGHPDLDTAALQSAMNWHYLPGRDADGDAATGWVYLRINYKLPEHPKGSAAH